MDTSNNGTVGQNGASARSITQDAIEESTEGLSLIGFTLFWRLSGIRVKHDALKTALQAANFGSFCPDPPSPRKGLRRAIEAWIASRTARGDTPDLAASEEDEEDEEGGDGKKRDQHTLVRVIVSGDWLVFVVVEEAIANLGLDFGTALRVLFNKKNGTLTVTTDPRGLPGEASMEEALQANNQLTRELKPYWVEYRDLHIAGDLSRMMRGIVDGMQAVSLRDHGGVYFVAESQRDALERLRILVEGFPTGGLGGHPFVCALGVVDRLAARRNLAKAVHDGLRREVRALTNDLARFASAKPGTVRKKTLDERMAAYMEMRQKIEMYADLISFRKDDILKSLEDLRGQARTVMLSDVMSEAVSDEGEGQPSIWGNPGTGGTYPARVEVA